MKRLYILSWLLAGLVVHGAAQNSCVWTNTGSTTPKTYVNPRLGFSYAFPPSFTPQDSSLLPKDAKGKGAILFALWKIPRDMATPSIVLFVEDPTQYNDSTAIAYARRIENTVKRTAHTSGVQPFDVAGMNFYRVDSRETAGDSIFSTAITGQIDRCEVNFQLRARTQQEIDNLVESVKAIRLHRPQPK